MKKKHFNSLLSIFTAFAFVFALSFFSSCGGSKGGYSKAKVHSGSGMGNKKHKNKHVWGK